MSDDVKISTKRPKKRRGFCKRVNIDGDSSNNVEENSSNRVQDKLPAESEVDVHIMQEATISSKRLKKYLSMIKMVPKVCDHRFKGLKRTTTNGCEGDLGLSENSKNMKGLPSELVIGCYCGYNS